MLTKYFFKDLWTHRLIHSSHIFFVSNFKQNEICERLNENVNRLMKIRIDLEVFHLLKMWCKWQWLFWMHEHQLDIWTHTHTHKLEMNTKTNYWNELLRNIWLMMFINTRSANRFRRGVDTGCAILKRSEIHNI